MLKLFWKEGRGREKNITNILTIYLARLHDSWQHYPFSSVVKKKKKNHHQTTTTNGMQEELFLYMLC